MIYWRRRKIQECDDELVNLEDHARYIFLVEQSV